MADKTEIEWTDSTWNPVTGCTKASPGCARCYAEAITLRFGRGGPFLPGQATIALHPDRLALPLRWKSPRRVFVNSMSDLFHEEVPLDFIKKVFAVMGEAERHTFQVLTKRHARLQEFVIILLTQGGLSDSIAMKAFQWGIFFMGHTLNLFHHFLREELPDSLFVRQFRYVGLALLTRHQGGLHV